MKTILTLLLISTAASALDLPPTHDVLRTTGKAVEAFWTQFPAVNCTELVTQNKLDKNGKVAFKRDSAFDYLVLMRRDDGDLVVEESRVRAKGEGKPEKMPLLVTNGFSTLLLIFHPRYQNSYEYSSPEEDVVDGVPVLRVRFRQSHNAPSPSCLRLRQRDYPLEWRGSAWIEPRSGSVIKIDADLNASMEDLGLRTLKAEVIYAPVQFPGGSQAQWLPSVATIEASTPLQNWRNIHRFTNYKHFTVETNTKTELPR